MEALRAQGLGLGGNMDVAVVVGEEGYLGQLRFADEIVRHKILDLVGDLSLAGPFWLPMWLACAQDMPSMPGW